MNQSLVTGANGQLGCELQRNTCPDGWEVVALDLRGITAIVAARVWAAVINSVDYIAVDKAESDVAAAWQVNASPAFDQPCAAGIPLVQVSTDYVFAGGKAGAWDVDDPVAPRGIYDASKLGGELAVRTSSARHAIVRTAWMASAHGHNFIRTMLRVGAKPNHLRVVDGQQRNPAGAADLTDMLITIARRPGEDTQVPTETSHLTMPAPSAGPVSPPRASTNLACAMIRRRSNPSPPPNIRRSRAGPPTRCSATQPSARPIASCHGLGRQRSTTFSTN